MSRSVRELGDESMWVGYKKLAMENNACNLGSGTPDLPLYSVLKDELAKAADTPSCNWYARPQGHIRLVEEVSKIYSPLVGREINPLTEIQVTIGAYEAIYFAFVSLLDEGDEVIAIDPYFDAYIADSKITGAKLVPISLTVQEGKWTLDMEQLEAAFTVKTKMVVVNTPHNPTGKVFSRAEIECIANLCKKNDCLVLSDEVYENVVFEGHEHVRIAALPGMWDRTITTCSAGKMLAITGWRIGWAYGGADLIEKLFRVCKCATFGCPTLLQEAIAGMFEHQRNLTDKGLTKDTFATSLTELLYSNYIKLHAVFTELNMPVIAAEGGYFMTIDCSQRSFSFQQDPDYIACGDPEDVKVVKWLVKWFKVLLLPLSLFYNQNSPNKSTKYLRVCFAKRAETIDTAVGLLKAVV